MKDDEIAKIVSHLTDIAKVYGQTQQLRERLAIFIVPILRQVRAPEERDIDIDDYC